ncbi:MAG: sensor histidine kinase, partial [Phycisphaerae bacterium]
MPSGQRSEPRRRHTWLMAGLWMVVLAVALAIMGMGLALRQARMLSTRLLLQVGRRAGDVAEQARNRVNEELGAELRRIADQLQGRSDLTAEEPHVWPEWVRGVYTWDGKELRAVVPAPREPERVAALVESRLTGTQVDSPRSYPGDDHIDILTGSLDGARIGVARLMRRDAPQGGIALAVGIDPERLRTRVLDLIDPLFATEDGLVLVSAADARTPWTQPQFAVTPFWTVQPSDAFVREQQVSVMGQTLAYVGLTALALAALLATMWLVVRVARREIALAHLKANFVADVSHELKTPLAAIQLFIETLQSGRVTSEKKRKEYYEIIGRESARLTALINNILDFARIEAGHKTYTLQPINVGEVIRETYDTYRAQLEHNGFGHSLTVSDGLPLVDADRDAIAQVLINFITNAIKYSEDERHLDIDVRPDTLRGRRGVLIS